MCLDTVDQETLQVREGYKVYNHEEKLRSEFRRNSQYDYSESGYIVPKRRWLEAWNKGYTIIAYPTEYKAGFHVFVDVEDAKKWASLYQVIHRVLVKDIVASGTQGKLRVVIAEKIYVMERVYTKASFVEEIGESDDFS